MQIMKHDYGFFERSLHNLRRLRAYSMDKSYLLEAPSQIFRGEDPGMTPRILEGGEDDPSQVVLTRSYARKPGNGLWKLGAVLQNRLPDDFLEFHRLYHEALVTTRTFPVHLWGEEKILKEIEDWRDLYPYPLRFFRFGEYWDNYGLWFGLWQSDPETNQWKVVITSHDNRDDHLDHGRESEYILAPSFHDWLEDFIARDGLPDPYMRIGPTGGFLDPA